MSSRPRLSIVHQNCAHCSYHHPQREDVFNITLQLILTSPQYSMYGHIQTLAQAEAEGIRAAGGTVDLFRVQESLPDEVLAKMHAPAKDSSIPELSSPKQLEEYDAFLFGIPTRYGNFPAQWRAFWDRTGGQWQSGGYWGKYAGLFVSSGTQGGGQESTAMAAMSTLAHHGIIYVPLGYKTTFHLLGDNSEVRGGSPWGAGTFAVCLGPIPSIDGRWKLTRCCRAATVPVSQRRKSWRLRRPRVKPSMRPCRRSISLDRVAIVCVRIGISR